MKELVQRFVEMTVYLFLLNTIWIAMEDGLVGYSQFIVIVSDSGTEITLYSGVDGWINREVFSSIEAQWHAFSIL